MGTVKDKNKGLTGKAATIKDIPDYSNHPAFVKKHQEAIAFIEKYGLPGGIGKKVTSTK